MVIHVSFQLMDSKRFFLCYSFDVDRNLLAIALKNIFLPFSVFFKLTRSCLHQTTKKVLAFINATLHTFVIFYPMCYIQR